jgi:hypothetical protein
MIVRIGTPAAAIRVPKVWVPPTGKPMRLCGVQAVTRGSETVFA